MTSSLGEMSSEPLIRATNIGVTRLGKSILVGTSLSVHAGEIVTLIGPNGAGKSTLVKVVLGLLKADAGETFKGAGLTIGYMPQKLSLDPSLPLTVQRFVSLAEKNIFRSHSNRVQECLALTGTEALRKRSMHSLSGGELQRVMLARALYNQPQLLVLDEPVQGVDVNGQAAIYQLITELRDRWHCGVLMISHDLHLVMAATNRVICLNHHVCCEGHPDSVSSHPEFLQLFGTGTQRGGIAPYTHHHDHHHDHFDAPHHD